MKEQRNQFQRMRTEALAAWVARKHKEVSRFHKRNKGKFDETSLRTLEGAVDECKTAMKELAQRGC